MQNRYNTRDAQEIKGTRQYDRKIKKFITTVSLIVVPFIVIASLLTYFYVNALLTGQIDLLKGSKDNPFGDVFGMIGKVGSDRVTGVIFGVDKDGIRTDVILVATIDKKNNKIDVISVPRDTRVSLAKERQAELKSLHKYVPTNGMMKITEVHAYAPSSKRNEYSVKEVERILGITVDYYVKVDVKAFRNIIDQVGGIKFDVARDLRYDDPVQNLHINLKKGSQTLNGNEAEQLVRFRHYPNGDLDRIKIQQAFLKEFYKQVFTPGNIVNLPAIAMTVYKYVDTNFGIADVGEMVDVITKVDASNVTMHMVPGVPETIKGVSYFIYDPDQTKELMDIIYNKETANKDNISKDTTNEDTISKDTTSKTSTTNKTAANKTTTKTTTDKAATKTTTNKTATNKTTNEEPITSNETSNKVTDEKINETPVTKPDLDTADTDITNIEVTDEIPYEE